MRRQIEQGDIVAAIGFGFVSWGFDRLEVALTFGIVASFAYFAASVAIDCARRVR